MHACAARTTVADRRADARARGPRPMRRHEMNAALVRVVRARVGGQRPPPPSALLPLPLSSLSSAWGGVASQRVPTDRSVTPTYVRPRGASQGTRRES